MTFHNPWMLTLLALLPLIWWQWLRQHPHAAIRFSSTHWLRRNGQSLRTSARILLPLLRTLAAAILIICLARPQKGNEETRIYSEGIAIQLIVDRSSSMAAEDFTNKRGQNINRLAVVKSVVEDFVLGVDDLQGRPDDLVGLVSFAGYADSTCPLTLDHEFLAETIRQTEIVSPEEGREEDGTAIGDALALAVEKLRDLDRRRDVSEANRIKSRIAILLTDGENNKGDVEPEKAAEIAQAFNIKVYTIGAGTDGIAKMPVTDPFGIVHYRPTRVSIDEETLNRIASVTGGKYFRATDSESLKNIYKEIDELEKTKTEEKRFMQYTELATHTVTLAGVKLPPLLAVALTLLTLEILLTNTMLRKIP